MKVLLTAFYGKFNASNILINMIDIRVDKLILTNSFVKLEHELNSIQLEEYDLILMFGINKFLKDEIRIDQTAKLDDIINTYLEPSPLRESALDSSVRAVTAEQIFLSASTAGIS